MTNAEELDLVFEDYYKNCLDWIQKRGLAAINGDHLGENAVPYWGDEELSTILKKAIEYNRTDVAKHMLDYFNVPDNLTLQERICYYQLLQETLT